MGEVALLMTEIIHHPSFDDAKPWLHDHFHHYIEPRKWSAEQEYEFKFGKKLPRRDINYNAILRQNGY